jgi:ribonuclease Z
MAPLFAYLGDTRISVFERNPWLFDYPVVITECTFLDDDQLKRAAQVGHTVWNQLAPVVAAHPNTLFVLIHFSLRHSDREVLDFFQHQRELAGSQWAENIVLLAHPESQLPEQHQRRSLLQNPIQAEGPELGEPRSGKHSR